VVGQVSRLPGCVAWEDPPDTLRYRMARWKSFLRSVGSEAPAAIATRLFLSLICIAFSGCAWQSEALKVGEDTYQVSANASPARGGITGAREMALRNANAKCDALGKKITVTDVRSEWAFPANGVATITFTCK